MKSQDVVVLLKLASLEDDAKDFNRAPFPPRIGCIFHAQSGGDARDQQDRGRRIA